MYSIIVVYSMKPYHILYILYTSYATSFLQLLSVRLYLQLFVGGLMSYTL
jgi:hypothetical protein